MDLWLSFWLFITSLGNASTYVVLVLASYFLIERRFAIKQLLLISAAYIASHTLKEFFRVPRPPENLWKVKVSGYSFPSGHATAASAFWSGFAFRYKKSLFILLSALLTLLISASRVILGVHRVVDVAVGILLGIAIAFMFEKLELHVERKQMLQKFRVNIPLLIFALPFLFVSVREVAFLAGFLSAHALLVNRFKAPKNSSMKLISFIVSLTLFFSTLFLQIFFYSPLAGFLAFVLPSYISNFTSK